MPAYRLIERINKCPAHTLFLLDCFLHIHLHENWSRAAGATEIIVRPECMQTPDGKVKQDDGDFTEYIIGNLEKYIEELIESKKPRMVGGVLKPPKKWTTKSMKTFPEIMKKYPAKMYSKLLRY